MAFFSCDWYRQKSALNAHDFVLPVTQFAAITPCDVIVQITDDSPKECYQMQHVLEA